jgi:hypothetical protein
MDKQKLHMPMAILFSILFAIFGVFLCSSFQFRGLTLHENVFPLFEDTGKIADGIFVLLGSGFMVDFFTEFSSENIAAQSFGTIITSPDVWPIIGTWFLSGFIGGVIVKGTKRGLIAAVGTFFLIFIFWIIFGFFANADLGAMFQTNILTTLGELFFALIFILPSGLLGGWLSGPEP